MTQHILKLNNYLLSPATQFLNDFLNLIREYKQSRKIYANARKTINELSSLTNNELHDIGIGRGDIYRLAYENADAQLRSIR